MAAETSNAVVDRLLRKRRIDLSTIKESYPSKSLHIPAYQLNAVQLHQQLILLHSHQPTLASAVLHLVDYALNDQQIEALACEGVEPKASSDALITSIEQWLNVQEHYSKPCPLLMPFIAKLTRIPIIQTPSPPPNPPQDAEHISAMGRCHFVQCSSGLQVSCGALLQRHILAGLESGQVCVAHLPDTIGEDVPQSFKSNNTRRITMNVPIKPCKANARTYVSVHTERVYDVRGVGGSDSLCLSCGGDGRAVLWRVDTGDELRAFSASSDALFRIATPQHNPSPALFAVAGADGIVRLYSMERPLSLRNFPHQTPITAIALSYSGDTVLTVCRGEKQIRQWDCSSALPNAVFGPLDSQPLFVDFMDNAVMAVSASSRMYIFDTRNHQQSLLNTEVLQGQRCTSMSIEGCITALGSSNGTLQLYNHATSLQRYENTGGRILHARRRVDSSEWMALLA